MQIVVHVPDELIDRVRARLPPPEMELLEAVALDALPRFFARVEASQDSPFSLIRGD